MADPATELAPLEIPWQLASTTQPLSAGEPAETALSLFFFEPDDATLTGRFAGQRVVFVKLAASVSPAAFPASLSRVAATFLGEGIPCLHLVLDLKVSDGAHAPGSIRPYFHAAAPLNRRMVQTGVVGGDSYEGESEAQAFGKSGTQVRESLRSHSSTTTVGASAGLGIGPISIGGSASNTTTDVASARAVSQVVDTTARQASQERRELLSHTTNVENIISLLRAKYVGTPHLSFSLSPQPLQQLSIDSSDPNLWFQQLLARRSSGIEGMQEFTAVVVVPSGSPFCLNARLRRVCLLDAPPGPFSLDERFTGSLMQFARLVDHLHAEFPIGTPLEDLDIDILGGLANAGAFKRPVIEGWGLRLLESLVIASVVSPGTTEGVSAAGRANYKHFLEVWLDTLKAEYERDVARSPLERGVLFGENRSLDTCFQAVAGGDGAPGAFVVSGSTATVSPLFRVPLPRGVFDIGGSRRLTRGDGGSPRSQAFETTTRWNTIEQRVATLLANQKATAVRPLEAGDPALVAVLLEHWRKLPADDPRNLEFEQAAALLKLGDGARKALAGAGATNLSSMAAALLAAPQIERHNVDADRLQQLFKKRRFENPPDLLKAAFSGRDGAAIVGAIGAGLAEDAAPQDAGPTRAGQAVRGGRTRAAKKTSRKPAR